MTIEQLEQRILDRVDNTALGVFIIDAFEQYSRGQNSGKPLVSGSLPLAAKELADEAWRMLPDSCKDIMKNLEITYKESLAADIENRFGGNDR